MPAAPKFRFGQVVMTPTAQSTFDEVFMYECLDRHLSGDWGDLDDEDKAVNENALLSGGRLLSSYKHPETGNKLWIITEHDRSVTTLLLPSDY